MGTSEFHVTVDVRLDLCIRDMKRFIRTFFSPCETARNAKFIHKKLLNPQIEHSLRCYIEPSPSISIEKFSGVWPRFTYIL